MQLPRTRWNVSRWCQPGWRLGPVKPEGSRKERARDAALDLPTGLTYSIQIAAKNLIVCPGLAVESDERCVCVWQLHVDGCMWRGGRQRA